MLNDYGQRRKKSQEIGDDEIATDLESPGCVSGYRAMWLTLRLNYGINVSRDRVEQILKELDLAGTEERKRHCLKRRKYSSSGPNLSFCEVDLTTFYINCMPNFFYCTDISCSS